MPSARRPPRVRRPLPAPSLMSRWFATVATWLLLIGGLLGWRKTAVPAAHRPELRRPRRNTLERLKTVAIDIIACIILFVSAFVAAGRALFSLCRPRAKPLAGDRHEGDSDPPLKTWSHWIWLSYTTFRDFILWRPRPPTSTTATGSESAHRRPELRKCTCSHKGRNLVVCIDGTSNQFSINNTNVVELYSRLIKDENQRTFYNSGIGTYATPSWRSLKYYMQVIINKLDLAFAFNFERMLLSAYVWLSENYEPGDRIFVFGFSRGAYQVRGLAAMIEQVGLIHKGNEDQIPFAYQLYAETKKVKNAAKMRAHFKKTFSHPDVCIHYAGLWDTVSSVGLVRDKTLPGTTDGLRFICYVRHALALHDRRVKFLPEYVHGGDGPLEDEVEGDTPHTKEVWFAGCHGDVGGGSVANEDLDQFGPALRWISFEARLAGLRFSEAPQDWNNEITEVHDSLGINPVWNLLELLPITHLTYTEATGTRNLPHLRRSRKVKARQKIHETALQAEKKFPRAELPDGLQWNAIRAHDDDPLIEQDPYTTAQGHLVRWEKSLDAGSGVPLPSELFEVLAELRSTELGRQSLLDSRNAASTLADLLRKFSRERIHISNVPRDLFDIVFELETDGLAASGSDVSANRGGQDNREIDVKQLHKPMKFQHSLRCMAHWPYDDRIIIGCTDGTIYIMDTKTRQIAHKLLGHTDWVVGVAVSPDGAQIASGGADGTVRVWSAESGSLLSRLEGHDDQVMSVAFSPDGSRIASCSVDHTIRVWDVASGATVVGPIQGHTDQVYLVAYSPDGAQIVSGSIDRTVRAWDAETGEARWTAVTLSSALSVAYSPDGMRIVAACDDAGAAILEADTGAIVRRPHCLSSLLSAVFSPDGQKIATGTRNGEVVLWNSVTGEWLDIFRGHCYNVWSLAFTADSTRIVSASLDKTVRFWDGM